MIRKKENAKKCLKRKTRKAIRIKKVINEVIRNRE